MENKQIVDLQNVGGGGQRQYRPIERSVLRSRTSYYARKTWNEPLSNLKGDNRELVVYTLVEDFSFTIDELVPLIKRHRSTLYRDFQSGRIKVLMKRKHFVEANEKLKNYLSYSRLNW